jgi:hypothetical protein
MRLSRLLEDAGEINNEQVNIKYHISLEDLGRLPGGQ